MNPKVKDAIEWIICIITAIILALLIRYFLGTPTIVENKSMYPTLIEGQRLIINRTTKTFNQEYERGDIVTLEAPSVTRVANYDKDVDSPIATFQKLNNGFEEFLYYFLEIGKKSYIKRVIGLPGEHLQIKDGLVYINGNLLNEPYLQEDVITTQNGTFYDVIIPEGCLFVMGDNREASMDSRSFGCVPREKIESKVWIRFWPFDLFGPVD